MRCGGTPNLRPRLEFWFQRFAILGQPPFGGWGVSFPVRLRHVHACAVAPIMAEALRLPVASMVEEQFHEESSNLIFAAMAVGSGPR
jgi:hypothetical protein